MTSPFLPLLMTRQEIFTNVFTQLKNAGYVRNKGDFARRLNYAQSHISCAFSGNRQACLSDRLFSRILEVFPQVNETYVRTGIGSVLRTSGPSLFTGIMPYEHPGNSLLDCLLAERDSLRQSLERVNQMIDILLPRDMKSAS